MTAAIAATRRSLPDQWTGGPLGWRAWSRRAVDSHRPGARSRCRGDSGILPGLQPPSFSSAVRHFQGRLAGNSASGLNWKRRRATLLWSAVIPRSLLALTWPEVLVALVTIRGVSEDFADGDLAIQRLCALAPHWTTVLRSLMRSSGSIFLNAK